MIGIGLAEAGLVPDALVRLGIRELLRRRAASLSNPGCETAMEEEEAFRRAIRADPVALVPDLANEQHYEVEPAFFEHVLGPRLKYSCGLWQEGVDDLAVAEEDMLALSFDRAELADGMSILDLGCGWGSLSLYMAERLPNAQILSLSNSKPQREFILRRCDERGIRNVDVRTADVNSFFADRVFDRVVSVEMFEHVRNHDLLLRRIASWLAPGGKLFVHHFAHRARSYPFETTGRDDWMGRHFFSGGMMPADDHLAHFQRDLCLERKWCVSGTHYQKTSEAWLERQDEQRDEILSILARVYGEDQAALWFQRWRIFFMACAELFGYRGGEEWWVTHLRMVREGRA